MKKTEAQLRQEQEQVERAPGAFTADGSFWDEGQHAHRGELDRFIRALVNQRRQGRLSPDQAASAIQAASFGHAFPCHQQWLNAKMDNGDPLWWSLAQTATAAEEFVKREGLGTNGHWCGERWARGPEKECSDERHRVMPSKQEVDQYVAAIVRKLEAVPVPKATSAVAAEPETRWPIADETWTGWGRLGYDASPEAAEKAAKLRSFGATPGFAKDDEVARA